MERRTVILLIAILAGVVALCVWGGPERKSENRDSNPERSATAETNTFKGFDLAKEKEHLQWLEGNYQTEEGWRNQALSDPYYAQYRPVIADFVSDGERTYALWRDRCDAGAARGNAFALMECTASLTGSTRSFIQLAGVLHDGSIHTSSKDAADSLAHLQDEREAARSQVHQLITDPREQMRLYGELERSRQYEEASRTLLDNRDYFGSWLLSAHSNLILINDAVRDEALRLDPIMRKYTDGV